jgi:ABC-type lipoprotein export system ATPase subunit
MQEREKSVIKSYGKSLVANLNIKVPQSSRTVAKMSGGQRKAVALITGAADFSNGAISAGKKKNHPTMVLR